MAADAKRKRADSIAPQDPRKKSLADPRKKLLPPQEEPEIVNDHEELNDRFQFNPLGLGGLGGMFSNSDESAILLMQNLQSHIKKKTAEKIAATDKDVSGKMNEIFQRFGTFNRTLEAGFDEQVAWLKGNSEELEEECVVAAKKLRAEHEKISVSAGNLVDALDKNYQTLVKTVRAFEKEIQELQLAQQSQLSAYHQEVAKILVGYKTTASTLSKDNKTEDQIRATLLNLLSI